MELKQNQPFFRGIYSNLTSTYFLLKNIKVLQRLSRSKFLSFVTKVNPNNGNETKSDIFHGIYSNLAKPLIGRKILKYFNDFYNLHISI